MQELLAVGEGILRAGSPKGSRPGARPPFPSGSRAALSTMP